MHCVWLRTLHTVSAVLVQVFVTPAAPHVVHGKQGVTPDVENVEPVTHAAAGVVNEAEVTALGMVPPLS